MITGNDIVNDLRSEIIEPNPTFFSNSRMLYLINLGQMEYVRKARVLQSYAFTSTVQGQSQYPMPPDWLGAEKVLYNLPNNGIDNWRPLNPTSIEKMGQESPNFLSNAPANQGTPAKYWITGSTLNIFLKPLTSGVNDLFMFYEAKPIKLLTLNDPISIDDSLYPGIRAFCLWKLWKQDNEDAKAAEEKQNFIDELGNGRKWKNKRMLDGKWGLDISSFVPYSYNSYNSGAVNGQVNPLNQ